MRAFFDACGAIGACELPLGADGRASGTALVTMATSDGYDKALAMDGEWIHPDLPAIAALLRPGRVDLRHLLPAHDGNPGRGL